MAGIVAGSLTFGLRTGFAFGGMLVAANGVATVDAAEAAPSSLTVRMRKTARLLAGIVGGGLTLAHRIRFAFGVMVVAVSGAAVAFGRVGAVIVDYYPFYVLF